MHLEGSQFEDVLLGEAAPAAVAHLATCAACRSRVDAFAETLADFNQASLAWASALPASSRAPLQRIGILPRPQRPALSAGFRPAAAWATVGGAVLVLGATLLTHGTRLTHGVPSAKADHRQAASAPDRQVQIAADDALLADIDSALDQPDSAPTLLFSQPEILAGR